MNEALEGTGAPLKVLSGYIGRVTVSVPWTALLKDSCKVEVSGLTLSVMPLIASRSSEEQSKCLTAFCHASRYALISVLQGFMQDFFVGDQYLPFILTIHFNPLYPKVA